jgi:hypothetical protein
MKSRLVDDRHWAKSFCCAVASGSSLTGCPLLRHGVAGQGRDGPVNQTAFGYGPSAGATERRRAQPPAVARSCQAHGAWHRATFGLAPAPCTALHPSAYTACHRLASNTARLITCAQRPRGGQRHHVCALNGLDQVPHPIFTALGPTRSHKSMAQMLPATKQHGNAFAPWVATSRGPKALLQPTLKCHAALGTYALSSKRRITDRGRPTPNTARPPLCLHRV